MFAKHSKQGDFRNKRFILSSQLREKLSEYWRSYENYIFVLTQCSVVQC